MAAITLWVKLALAAAAVALSSATTLRLLPAGVSTSAGVELIAGFSVCATDYPNGLSIVCDAPGASAAVFLVNSVFQRREGVAPYAINGDNNGNLFAWTPPTGPVTLQCQPVGAPAVTVAGTFACAAATAAATTTAAPTVAATKTPSPSLPAIPPPTIAPPAGGPVLRAVRAGAGGNTNTISTLANGFAICPTDFAGGAAIICDAAGAASVTFDVNGAAARTENFAPFTIAGDGNGVVNPWTTYPSGAVTIKCTTAAGASVTVAGTICGNTVPVPTQTAGAPVPTQTAAAPPAAAVGVDQAYCVTKKASAYFGNLAQDWTADGESLWFRQFDDRTGIVGSGFAPLTYKFTVPIASTYGFTLDMNVGGGVDHNDVFTTMVQGGWDARGNNKDTLQPQTLRFTGATKAYHNNPNGRQKLAFTVDFNPHTFATANVLQPGTEYTIIIAGRSSKVQLWGLILFPCNGDQCKVGTSHWQQYVGLCNV